MLYGPVVPGLEYRFDVVHVEIFGLLVIIKPEEVVVRDFFDIRVLAGPWIPIFIDVPIWISPNEILQVKLVRHGKFDVLQEDFLALLVVFKDLPIRTVHCIREIIIWQIFDNLNP